MGHRVASAPEVRRLVEARRRHAAVDRSLLRDRTLLFSAADTATTTATAFHYRVRVLVVQVRSGLENVSGHVQRSEVRLQRIHGRLQSQQQLRHVTLHDGGIIFLINNNKTREYCI